MSTIKPFQINVPDSKIEHLKQKLALADFPADNDQSWERGAPVGDVERLAKTWQTTFDWRAVENNLNKLPHYIASLDIGSLRDFGVHFIHKRSTNVDAVPLLFLHGWPGSFIEVTRILDPLVHENSGPSFHVVAPSLIDFGFSSAIIQAGDVGSVIARYMAMSFGNSHCMALHTNTPLPSEPKEDTHPDLYKQLQKQPIAEAELKALVRAGEVSKVGMGYYNMQSTKPTTIGFSLRDSPVGLLAWIYEKLVQWSDAYEWTDEEILTWVSIHWFSTAGPDAPSNLYYSFEQSDPIAFIAAGAFIDLPLGISRFKNDLVLLPKLWNQTLGPVVFQEEHERGGHFAAWEQPGAIVGDLRLMFGDSDIGRKFRNSLQDRTTV
ncbi:epoxide hydrolase [Fusarium longipes]|uniref:Epoxide hydrolase n=1 Tax=Fusarium longipes TaxID=694270 RepID=A0A395T1S3_9HYPO|nr:epoxide hydrolase [Fusarium longipes]